MKILYSEELYLHFREPLSLHDEDHVQAWSKFKNKSSNLGSVETGFNLGRIKQQHDFQEYFEYHEITLNWNTKVFSRF